METPIKSEMLQYEIPPIVPSPSESIEIPIKSEIPQFEIPLIVPSSESNILKRTLTFEVPPVPEKIVKIEFEGEHCGSDPDDDVDDGDDFGFLHCPRDERMFDDSFDDISAPPNLLAEPSSDSTDPSSSISENCGSHSLDEFVWEPLPQPAIAPQLRREQFTAPVGPVSNFSSPYEAFISIWDRKTMENIAAESNRYGEQKLEAALRDGSLGGHSRKLSYTNTDADELYVFFALILATGIVYKADLTEYWSANGEVFDTPNFSRYMSYTRFSSIAQMLHFVNNEDGISHRSKSDAKIAKIAPIIQHLNEKFQGLYQLGQCIALDESLTQLKGGISISQYIKRELGSKGIKTYEVCDSSSGYLWRLKVHTGANEEDHLGHTTSPVLELLKGLENKGHTVFMDNYYSSPTLARALKSQGFDCVGTLHASRQHVPAHLLALSKQPLALGSLQGVTSGDVDVLIWRERRVVFLTSTYHGAALFSKDGKVKPKLVHDYNVCMGGVDRKDQMLSAYPVERKGTMVWYKKFFRRLLNVSVFNAYILYKEGRAPKQPPHLKHRQFRKNLIKDILEKHGQRRTVTLVPALMASKVKFSEEMLRHLPKEFPFSEKLKQRKRGTCGVCRKRSSYMCVGCDVALCINNCFAQFHS